MPRSNTKIINVNDDFSDADIDSDNESIVSDSSDSDSSVIVKSASRAQQGGDYPNNPVVPQQIDLQRPPQQEQEQFPVQPQVQEQAQVQEQEVDPPKEHKQNDTVAASANELLLPAGLVQEPMIVQRQEEQGMEKELEPQMVAEEQAPKENQPAKKTEGICSSAIRVDDEQVEMVNVIACAMEFALKQSFVASNGKNIADILNEMLELLKSFATTPAPTNPQ